MLEKYKQDESGRSMVEMLGVLAIIGVLSIGGIAGYTHAMNKHHSNTIFQNVSEMAIDSSAQLLSGNRMSLASHGDSINGTYSLDWNSDYSEKEMDFSIKVGRIPNGVCDQIRNTEYKMAYLVLINGTESGDCSTENNEVEFIFNDNLSTEPPSNNSDTVIDEDLFNEPEPDTAEKTSKYEECLNDFGNSNQFNEWCLCYANEKIWSYHGNDIGLDCIMNTNLSCECCNCLAYTPAEFAEDDCGITCVQKARESGWYYN